jgi:hypothetical protein
VEAPAWGGESGMEASVWGGELLLEAPAWGGERHMEAPTWGDELRVEAWADVGRRVAHGGAGVGVASCSWRRRRCGAVSGSRRRRRRCGVASYAWRLFYFFNPCPIFLGIDFVEKDCNISLFPVKVVPVNLFLGNFVGKLFPYCFWRFPSNSALRKHVNSSSQNIYSIKYTLTSLVVTAGAP